MECDRRTDKRVVAPMCHTSYGQDTKKFVQNAVNGQKPLSLKTQNAVFLKTKTKTTLH